MVRSMVGGVCVWHSLGMCSCHGLCGIGGGWGLVYVWCSACVVCRVCVVGVLSFWVG